jgi:glycosyltransferase involved in cell wall biosynthesis
MIMNNVEPPLVSVIITSYNRAKWLKQAIDSVLEQDYPNLELVISDNCSTDGTDELISTYQHDSRVKYYKNNTNIGMIANFYKAFLELAKGKYVTHVSSDDYLCNNTFLSKGVDAFETHPDVEIFFAVNLILYEDTNTLKKDELFHLLNDYFKKKKVGGKEIFLNFPKVHGLGFGAGIMRLASFNNVVVDRAIPTSLDIQIVLQLLMIGDAYFLEEESYVFRRHEGQASQSYTTAEQFINNNRCVEIPYKIAKEKQFLNEQAIDKWRYNMLYPEIRYGMHHLLRMNKAEHQKFYQYAKTNFPEMIKRIVREPKYLVKRILFAKNK